jgi:nucleotide-binding universal stress UspA family protein
MSELRKILVPIDGSDASCRAAAVAATLARGFGAQITLLHVAGDRRAHMAPEAAFEHCEAWLGGSSAERRSEQGDPATQIVAVARGQEFDHIVIGSRGLSPSAEQLLGSVSDRVLRQASCPVTVVH